MKTLFTTLLLFLTLATFSQRNINFKGGELKNVTIHKFDNIGLLNEFSTLNNFGQVQKGILATTTDTSILYIWDGSQWKKSDSIFSDVINKKIYFNSDGQVVSEAESLNGISSEKSFFVAPEYTTENSKQNFLFSVDGVSGIGISNGLTGFFAHQELGHDYLTLLSESYIKLRAKQDIEVQKVIGVDTLNISIKGLTIQLKNGESILELKNNGILLEYAGQRIVIDDNGINIGNGTYIVANPNPPSNNGSSSGHDDF